ncbi:MAG: hypothetical protein FWC42_09805 [Proteobacteria bacterium]|nr:hypothetical protein [Pseudomonadota bacterium]
MRASLIVCGVIYISIGVFALDMQVSKGETLILNVLFYPFRVLTTLSGFIALIAIVLGARELKAQGFNVSSLAAILVSLPIVVGHIVVLNRIWPALMGV